MGNEWLAGAAFLSILLAGYTSGVLGLVLSTVLIVVFAEIIPQVRTPMKGHLLNACLTQSGAETTSMLGAAGLLLPTWARVWSLHGVADPRLHAGPRASGMAAVLCAG